MNLFTLLIGMPGPMEIIIILVIVVLIFGGKKIPELMKGLGQGMKEFKKATKEEPKAESSDSQDTKE